MKITIIGTGYVGLVTGTCLAEFGHQICCLDNDPAKIELLKSGKVPIYEPGLKELIAKNTAEGRLSFTDNLAAALNQARAVFIAVGTPASRRGDGFADLSYIYSAARDIAPFLNEYTVVILKSTVPIGTGREVDRIIREENPGAEFDVVSNPEFLREGSAIVDFLQPNRVVIGADSRKAEKVLLDIYHPLALINTPFVVTTLETSELIKYAANTFLAVKISFINEMANLCEMIRADVTDLARGIGLDDRIGSKFLQAGPGYGGSCFPKDTMALLRIAQEHGAAARIVEAAVEVNNAQKARMIKKIRDAMGGSVAGKTIAVLGLTFKPDTDDIRESPALTIIPAMTEKGARVQVFDPKGMAETRKILPQLDYAEDSYSACRNADAVVLITDWNQFRTLDLDRLRLVMKSPVFIDLRNVYEPQEMKKLGFDYFSLGRGAA